MPLDSSRMSSTLFGIFQSKGFTGAQLMNFCQMVSIGSVNSMVGKAFTTTDLGTIPGNGVGAGVGIMSVDEANTSSTIVSTAQGFGWVGTRLKDTADAIAEALVIECMLATLSSTHTPVYEGAGIVDIGSYTVDQGEWANNIFAEGTARGFIGSQFMNYCIAISTGCVTGFTTATGSVAIAGAPTGTPVPNKPGVGVGVVS